MKKVVIFSGRFQPFHMGHFKTYRQLLKKFPDADVYIATSNKTDSQKSPFNFNEKKMIMTRMFKIPSNRIVQIKNPYSPMEILSKYPDDSTIYIAAVGEKDEQRLGGRYFQSYDPNLEFQPYPIAGYVYLAPALPDAISGTEVRQWISVPDETEAENGFTQAYDKFNKEIYTLIRSKLLSMNEMAKTDLDDVEQFADTKLSPYDFEFGRDVDHFFARLNDPRNGKEISKPEMIGFFKRLIRNRKAFDDFTKKYLEFVVTDKRTNINIPFKTMANRLIAKTIMRKSVFKSPDPILQIETVKSNEDITIPVDIGDTVLMGRFKNKKVKVKSIDKDEHGMPTINGKKAVTFRKTKESINETVTEDEIKATIESLDRAAKAAGFQLDRKPNTKPGKSATSHARWIHKSVVGMGMKPRDLILNQSPHVALVSSKSEGLKVAAYPAEGSSIKRIPWSYVHGTPKEWSDKRKWNELLGQTNESLLLEGGAYGHMSHPFDIDMDLTFGDLKSIVSKALDGELELAREKTDGQALAISWKNGKLIAARNKGNLANAGANAMTEDELITKFAGRGEISDAFAFAIRDLRKAISALPENEKQKIFQEGRAFMNCEIIYPESVNVIPYGQSLIVFHGTMEYDDAGNPISENPQAGFLLANMIQDVNANVQDKFSIQGPPIQTLPKSKELKAKKPYYFNKINQLQKEYGLGDDSGISEYHQEWWSEWIDANAPGQLSKDEKAGLIKRWAFLDKGFRLKDINDPAVKEWADKVDKIDLKRITKENIMKFERIFLGVGADVLSFMTSVLTANPEVARKQMLTSLRSTIEDIQKSGDPSSIKKLELELKRLQDLGGFDKIVPSEGIVFVYKGNTYKLTGAFAPLNQILGIFKYSR